MLKLVHAHPHDRVFDGGNFFELAVQQRHDQGIQNFTLLNAAVKQCVVMHRIGFVKTTQIAGEQVDVGSFVVADQKLVEALQCKFACAAAPRLGSTLAWLFGNGQGRRGFAHASCSSNKAISTATRAASRPLSV